MNLPNDKHLVNEIYHLAGHVLGTGEGFVDPVFFTPVQWEEFARRLRSYLGDLERRPPAGTDVCWPPRGRRSGRCLLVR